MDTLPSIGTQPRTAATKVSTGPRNVIIAAIGLLSLILYLAILARNGGVFTYTLDAPYTHMILADQIMQGNYGLNPGESASPSSSILYPFLLAAVAGLPLGQFAPLLICLLATMGTALLIYAVVREVGIEVDRLSTLQLGVITASFALAFNLVGLAFAGLEHSLHVTLTIVSLLGLLRFVRRQEADWWWLAAITLLPLLRFEATAALAADMLVLVALGKWRHALLVGTIGAAGVVGFGFFLHSLGLPWLPISVLIRSEVASSGIGVGESGGFAVVRAVYTAFRSNLLEYGGTLISLLIIVGLWGVSREIGSFRYGKAGWPKYTAVGFFIVIAMGQLLGGSLHSFSRYEIYVLVLGACAVLVAWKDEVNFALRRVTWLACIGFCMTMLFLFSGYVFRGTDAISASNNIYSQQYQMRRFVTDYWKQPYATNHPRLVTWRNPHHLLDLSGTDGRSAFAALPPSPAATIVAATVPDLSWADRLAQEQGVGLAMLYDDRGGTPSTWRLVGKLRLEDRVVTAIGPVVNFYATRPADAPRLTAMLMAFAPSLHKGAKLELVQ